MANIAENRVIFNGQREAVVCARARASLPTIQEYGGMFKSLGGGIVSAIEGRLMEETFSLNSISKMPEDLDIEDSAGGDLVFQAMTNWRRAKPKLEKAEWVSKKALSSKQEFLEWVRDFHPEFADLGEKYKENMRVHGVKSWYDWAIANWGTKTEPFDVAWGAMGEQSVEVSFLTAWTPPLPVLKKMSEEIGLSIMVSTFDPDMSESVVMSIDGGEVSSSEKTAGPLSWKKIRSMPSGRRKRGGRVCLPEMVRAMIDIDVDGIEEGLRTANVGGLTEKCVFGVSCLDILASHFLDCCRHSSKPEQREMIGGILDTVLDAFPQLLMERLSNGEVLGNILSSGGYANVSKHVEDAKSARGLLAHAIEAGHFRTTVGLLEKSCFSKVEIEGMAMDMLRREEFGILSALLETGSVGGKVLSRMGETVRSWFRSDDSSWDEEKRGMLAKIEALSISSGMRRNKRSIGKKAL